MKQFTVTGRQRGDELEVYEVRRDAWFQTV